MEVKIYPVDILNTNQSPTKTDDLRCNAFFKTFPHKHYGIQVNNI